MNRKEVAEQLKHVIQNQVNLIPEDYFALDEAIKELEKNCENCEHSHQRGSRGYFCGIYDFRIPDVDEFFCGDHESLAPF